VVCHNLVFGAVDPRPRLHRFRRVLLVGEQSKSDGATGLCSSTLVSNQRTEEVAGDGGADCIPEGMQAPMDHQLETLKKTLDAGSDGPCSSSNSLVNLETCGRKFIN